ncbi:uncharacterized protein LOC9648591 [Selaginella moellendorffii]|uniref:uncharacterized protein LOC9648591 n=1 Tax=Selaginella moellendorffii TaxID=88036 RepID=UPI000D1D0BC1|nr:uncharacterized protein LOC9648591 [Selaginella moellendorffii]|eukprot:XP_024545651.1 uncharacterized protein LOC9648591 [Selaginella moellendorffii]
MKGSPPTFSTALGNSTIADRKMAKDMGKRGAIDYIPGYDRVQSLAVILLYVQVISVPCISIHFPNFISSGVLLANLAIALFALVAIESGSHSLGRAYAALLVCALHTSPWRSGKFLTCWIFLVFAWFAAFSFCSPVHLQPNQHREASDRKPMISIQSVSSSEKIDSLPIRGDRPSSYYQRLVQPTAATSVESTPAFHSRQTSISDQILGGSIYDPTYYASLFRIQEKENCSSSSTKDIGDDNEKRASGE